MRISDSAISAHRSPQVRCCRRDVCSIQIKRRSEKSGAVQQEINIYGTWTRGYVDTDVFVGMVLNGQIADPVV